MGFPMLSYPSAFGLEPAASGTTNDSPMPFRFLDLPKEIRLMVYERFLVTTYRDGIPLKDGQYGFTLVTTVVPGISVLATCHQIKLEASHTLLPVLQKVLLAPPIVAIEAGHLFTLIDLERCSCSPGITLLGKVVSCLRHPRTVGRIMRYRRGRLTAQQLWKRLRLGPLIKADDERRLRAFARFILRAAKYISGKTSTIYAYPPLTVVIEVPDTFQGMPYTVSTSYIRSVAYKVLGPGISPPPPTTTVVADLPWLLSRFAFRMSILCRFYSVVTLVVKLRLVEIGKTGRYVSKQGFQMALMRGLAGAGWMGRGVLYFGGRATKAISEEV